MKDGVAAQILLALDADAEKIRSEVLRMLSGSAEWPSPGVRGFRRRRSRAVQNPLVVHGPQPPQPTPFRALLPVVLGWLLFGLASGAGLLVGWLIWG